MVPDTVWLSKQTGRLKKLSVAESRILAGNSGPARSHCPSFTVLQTSRVCPVFESITVVPGRQLQVTVLAFSCLTTTQCSMSSAVGGGNWLRMGGEVAATGCFFAAQPARSRHETSQAFLIPPFRSLWPACRWQSWLHPNFHLYGLGRCLQGNAPARDGSRPGPSRGSECYGIYRQLTLPSVSK